MSKDKKKKQKESEATPLPFALTLPETQDLPPDMQKYFDVCAQELGFLPNVLRAYAHDVDQLRVFSRLYNTLMLAESNLTTLDREMIAVVVSSLNRCYYCLVAHGQAVRQLSGNPVLGEMLVMNWHAADLEPRQRAMLSFAEKMTKAAHEIAEYDREGLRDAGFTDKEIWDIANVAGFFNMTNRVASATDMRPNPEYHGQNR